MPERLKFPEPASMKKFFKKSEDYQELRGEHRTFSLGFYMWRRNNSNGEVSLFI